MMNEMIYAKKYMCENVDLNRVCENEDEKKKFEKKKPKIFY